MRAKAAALVLLFLLPLATSGVGAQAPEERNARPLSVLEYHPYPDPPRGEEGGDPFGVPYADTGRDWMSQYYDAYWFPTTRFDGVLESDYARDGSITGMREFYERYREHVDARLAEDAPLVATVDGALDGDEARVEARFTAKADLQTQRAVLRMVVYEDDIRYVGDNGVAVHRFVVRHILPETPIQGLAAGERATANHTFTVDPAWNRDRLGVVAFVQNEDEASPPWELREVLQAATYEFDQDGPTVQGTRSVLLEMYTATWCPSCVYGDGAVDLLAEEYGAPSSLGDHGPWTYLEAPGLLRAAIGLGAGALLAALLLTGGAGRARRGGGAP